MTPAPTSEATPTQATVSRTRFSTTEADVVRDTCLALFGGNVTITGSDGPWGLDMEVLDAGTLSVSAIRLAADTDFHMAGEDAVLVQSVRGGRVSVETRGPERRYSTGDVFLGNFPTASYHGRSSDTDMQIIAIPTGLLRSVTGLPEDAPLGIQSEATVADAATRWQPVAQLVEELLTTPPTAQSPLLLGSISRVAAAAALDLFPNTAMSHTQSSDRVDGHDSHPAALRRAITYIDAHPDHDIGLIDIARAASVTPRAVQTAFRRHKNTTPIAYLRRVRLHRAHADLLHAHPDNGETLTTIAARWGYANLDRFSRHYQDTYGEPPSSTLQR